MAFGSRVTSCVAAWTPRSTKDYVLTLLFMKYVSDKYAGKPSALIVVPKDGGFGRTLRQTAAEADRRGCAAGRAGSAHRQEARDLKDAAMQQFLTGQTRLPGFHALKQAMMQELLTGRVRLVEPLERTGA
jgi:hypothetical protein